MLVFKEKILKLWQYSKISRRGVQNGTAVELFQPSLILKIVRLGIFFSIFSIDTILFDYYYPLDLTWIWYVGYTSSKSNPYVNKNSSFIDTTGLDASLWFCRIDVRRISGEVTTTTYSNGNRLSITSFPDTFYNDADQEVEGEQYFLRYYIQIDNDISSGYLYSTN